MRPQLIEKLPRHGLVRGGPSARGVTEQTFYKVQIPNGHLTGKVLAKSQHWYGFWEENVRFQRNHCGYFPFCGRPHHVDYVLHHVLAFSPVKEHLSREKFCRNAPQRPDVDLFRVTFAFQQKFRGPVFPRAHVKMVFGPFGQVGRQPEVAYFQHPGRHVNEHVLGFEVAVADAVPVEVPDASEQLEEEELDLVGGHLVREVLGSDLFCLNKKN